MKKTIIITVLALTSYAFAQTEAPVTPAPETSHAEDTIKKTDEKAAMGSEKHKGHHAGKKAKKHKKAHHGKKHKKTDK